MRRGSRRGGVPHAERSIEPRIHRCSAFACADQTDFKTAFMRRGGVIALSSGRYPARCAAIIPRFSQRIRRGDRPYCAAARGPCAMVQPWSLNLLAVDDIDINLELIEWMARRLGHRVRVARNGAQAIQLLTREIFDAVIMDAQMPVMSGIEATRRIRAEQDPVLDADVYIIA